MIVKILNRSASFNGSWLYHFHDKRSASSESGKKSSDRVLLYGLRNLGTNDPETAFKQMALTWHNANDLKVKAGISNKGRKCTTPLITIVLSYNSGYQPQAEEVEQDVESILATAGLIDNQAVWVVHRDTENIHAHIIVNAVNPDNGIASQFDNKVAKQLQEWARDKERSIGLQCIGRESAVHKKQCRKFIPVAERRARERIAHMPHLIKIADELSSQLGCEWQELRDRERKAISEVYERLDIIREDSRTQRKMIKSQAAKKIRNIYKKEKNPFFLTIAWLEKNEWKRLGKRAYAARRLFYRREQTLSGILLNAIHFSLSDAPNKRSFIEYLTSSDARKRGLEGWISYEYECLRNNQKYKKEDRVRAIRFAEGQCYVALSRNIQYQINQEKEALTLLAAEYQERKRNLKKRGNERWELLGRISASRHKYEL